MLFWAEMRSTANLFNKSNIPTEFEKSQLMDQLGHILGKRIITYPQILRKYGIGKSTSYEDKKRLLGLDEKQSPVEVSPNELKFIAKMQENAAGAAKANWSWRIVQEAEEKQKKGWYPFFVTLTVDPKMCQGQTHLVQGREVSYDSPEHLWRTGREFRLYIRRLAEIAARELGHPPPRKKARGFGYRPESDYVTYAGVLEHGKTQEHHHAHIMVWMREIPSNWKIDPNSGRPKSARTERECRPIRPLWPWAIASQKPALYFRTKGDIWSQLGHVVPLDKKTGKTIKINQVAAVGNYVTKYMQKGTKQWHHRMKCTRNLGMQKLLRKIKSLPLTAVRQLAMRPPNSKLLRSVSLTHSVPQGLTRCIAKRVIFAHRYHYGSMELKELMKTNYEHYKAMLRNVRDGARPDRMPLAEFYDWVQEFLPEETGFCETEMLKAHESLGDDYPRTTHKVEPTIFGANEIGFTQCI
jgi:hypothetical protein